MLKKIYVSRLSNINITPPVANNVYTINDFNVSDQIYDNQRESKEISSNSNERSLRHNLERYL